MSLIKNIDKDKKNLRVNIRNINLINNLLNKPIDKIEIDLKNIEDFTNLSSYLMEQGNTEVCINYLTKDKNVKFVLEKNRDILKEGSSIILTLAKSVSDEENRFKRINVQKIASLSELINKPIEEVLFNLKSLKELNEISKIIPNDGNTVVKIKLRDQNNELDFTLKNKRNVDRKMLNIIRNKEISAIIR